MVITKKELYYNCNFFRNKLNIVKIFQGKYMNELNNLYRKSAKQQVLLHELDSAKNVHKKTLNRGFVYFPVSNVSYEKKLVIDELKDLKQKIRSKEQK